QNTLGRVQRELQAAFAVANASAYIQQVGSTAELTHPERIAVLAEYTNAVVGSVAKNLGIDPNMRGASNVIPEIGVTVRDGKARFQVGGARGITLFDISGSDSVAHTHLPDERGDRYTGYSKEDIDGLIAIKIQDAADNSSGSAKQRLIASINDRPGVSALNTADGGFLIDNSEVRKAMVVELNNPNSKVVAYVDVEGNRYTEGNIPEGASIVGLEFVTGGKYNQYNLLTDASAKRVFGEGEIEGFSLHDKEGKQVAILPVSQGEPSENVKYYKAGIPFQIQFNEIVRDNRETIDSAPNFGLGTPVDLRKTIAVLSDVLETNPQAAQHFLSGQVIEFNNFRIQLSDGPNRLGDRDVRITTADGLNYKTTIENYSNTAYVLSKLVPSSVLSRDTTDQVLVLNNDGAVAGSYPGIAPIVPTSAIPFSTLGSMQLLSQWGFENTRQVAARAATGFTDQQSVQNASSQGLKQRQVAVDPLVVHHDVVDVVTNGTKRQFNDFSNGRITINLPNGQNVQLNSVNPLDGQVTLEVVDSRGNSTLVVLDDQALANSISKSRTVGQVQVRQKQSVGVGGGGSLSETITPVSDILLPEPASDYILPLDPNNVVPVVNRASGTSVVSGGYSNTGPNFVQRRNDYGYRSSLEDLELRQYLTNGSTVSPPNGVPRKTFTNILNTDVGEFGSKLIPNRLLQGVGKAAKVISVVGDVLNAFSFGANIPGYVGEVADGKGLFGPTVRLLGNTLTFGNQLSDLPTVNPLKETVDRSTGAFVATYNFLDSLGVNKQINNFASTTAVIGSAPFNFLGASSDWVGQALQRVGNTVSRFEQSSPIVQSVLTAPRLAFSSLNHIIKTGESTAG
ncbi:MAG: hypothetical protein IM492_05305, partial [Microcystis sp. M040S2]|uniref:hypothetical protein n=1 Tax=Microcystis sp. M040S2 TaxID=2771165 RepID=UPI00258C51DF